MKINAIRVPVTGPVEVISYDRKDELDVLQEQVGGYIEVVTATQHVTFYVNEEGKLMGLPINKRATEYWWSINPSYRGHDVLCGTAVILGEIDGDGYSGSVDTNLIADPLLNPIG